MTFRLILTTWTHIRHNILYSQLNKHNVNLKNTFGLAAIITIEPNMMPNTKPALISSSPKEDIPYFFVQMLQLLSISLLALRSYYLRAATIRGRLLFESGYYSRAGTIRGWLLLQGGYYSRATTITGWLLFEGGYYLRAATIESSYYLRAATIQGRRLFLWKAWRHQRRLDKLCMSQIAMVGKRCQ